VHRHKFGRRVVETLAGQRTLCNKGVWYCKVTQGCVIPRTVVPLSRRLPGTVVAAPRALLRTGRVPPSLARVAGMCVGFTIMATRWRYLWVVLRRRAGRTVRASGAGRLLLTDCGARHGRRHHGVVVAAAYYAPWWGFAWLRVTFDDVDVTHLRRRLWRWVLRWSHYRRHVGVGVGVLNTTVDNVAAATQDISCDVNNFIASPLRKIMYY